jgi:hypothetical protein
LDAGNLAGDVIGGGDAGEFLRGRLVGVVFHAAIKADYRRMPSGLPEKIAREGHCLSQVRFLERIYPAGFGRFSYVGTMKAH